MRGKLLPLSLVMIGLVLAACSDRPGNPPTAPVSFNVTGQATCTKADADLLAKQIDVLFDKSVRQTARDHVKLIVAACPNAREQVLNYVNAILGWRQTQPTKVIGSNDALWKYLTTLFHYIGFTLENSFHALDGSGFVGVCSPGVVCTLISQNRTSGIQIAANALDKRYLVSGAVASCDPFKSKSTLEPSGWCVEISIDPKSTPVFQFLGDGATVEVCVAEGSDEDLGEADVGTEKRSKLGQLSSGSAAVRLKPVRSPFFTSTCSEAVIATRGEQDAGGSILAQARRAAGRAVRGAFDLFAPASLYAIHGLTNTGGTRTASLFGPVDAYAFLATYEKCAVGQPPCTPERGYATLATLNPGDITVQASYGDINNKVLVINQAGGAASQKLGIQYIAHPDTQPGQAKFATSGRFRIRWQSLVGSPTVKSAPLIVRNAAGAAVARFEYLQGSSAKAGPITYNGKPVSTGENQNLTWAQNVSQTFEIILDLDQTPGQTSFGLVNADGTVKTLVGNVPFLDQTADRTFGQVGWELTGIDAQIIVTNDFKIAGATDLNP